MAELCKNKKEEKIGGEGPAANSGRRVSSGEQGPANSFCMCCDVTRLDPKHRSSLRFGVLLCNHIRFISHAQAHNPPLHAVTAERVLRREQQQEQEEQLFAIKDVLLSSTIFSLIPKEARTNRRRSRDQLFLLILLPSRLQPQPIGSTDTGSRLLGEPSASAQLIFSLFSSVTRRFPVERRRRLFRIRART